MDENKLEAPAASPETAIANPLSFQQIVTRDRIAALKAEFANMVVTDNKSLEVVKRSRTLVKTHRTEIEKRRLEMGRKLLADKAIVDGEAKELIALLEAIEDPLEKEIKRFTEAKERDRLEKEQAEEKRIAGLRQQLADHISLFTQNVESAIDVDMVDQAVQSAHSSAPTIPDIQTEINIALNDLTKLAVVKKQHLSVLAEQKRLQEENDRLKLERAEMEQAQKDRDELRRRVTDTLAGIRDALKFATSPAEVDQLIESVDVTGSDFGAFAADFTAGVLDIRKYGEELKQSIVDRQERERLQKESNDAKEQKRREEESERIRKEQEADALFNGRAGDLIKLGFTNPNSPDEFIFETLRIHKTEMMIATPAEWNDMFKNTAAAMDRIIADREKRSRELLPDRQLMLDHLMSRMLPAPDVLGITSAEAIAVWQDIRAHNDKFKAWGKNQIETKCQ